MEEATSGFAGLLRQLRAGAGLTQQELAKAAGVSPRSVSDLERGINRTARQDTAVRLAGALGLAEPVRSLFVAAALGRIPAAQVLAAGRGQAPGGSPASAGGMHGFVPALTSFVGRDGPVREVAGLLDRGRLVTVTGPGGTGKTRLAAEVARQVAGRYADGAWLVELAPVAGSAQVAAVVAALGAAGVLAQPFVAMACWHPFSDEAVAAIRAAGLRRAIALPLYAQYSETTTGSSLKALARAVTGSGGAIDVAEVCSYAAAPGLVTAIGRSITDALATLPDGMRDSAPVLFSAHGLPESYIRRGDPYLDQIRTTVAAVTRHLDLGPRAHLAFQSRVGRQKWLSPYTEAALDELIDAGARAIVVVPVAFTGEHVETLQELDIVYRDRAMARGLTHFARARTVGTDPDFIAALVEECLAAARTKKWLVH